MAAKRKLDAKAFAQQKRKRRQWLTFVRMCRYGVNNFTRNTWLTIAATAVMTITLLIVFVTLAARNVLVDTIGEIRDKVNVSIYVKQIRPSTIQIRFLLIFVSSGEVLVRQTGSTKLAGPGTYISKNFTIHAAVDGVVRFTKVKKGRFTGKTAPRTQVSVQVPKADAAVAVK